jgi:hypothetical protein
VTPKTNTGLEEARKLLACEEDAIRVEPQPESKLTADGWVLSAKLQKPKFEPRILTNLAEQRSRSNDDEALREKERAWVGKKKVYDRGLCATGTDLGIRMPDNDALNTPPRIRSNKIVDKTPVLNVGKQKGHNINNSGAIDKHKEMVERLRVDRIKSYDKPGKSQAENSRSPQPTNTDEKPDAKAAQGKAENSRSPQPTNTDEKPDVMQTPKNKNQSRSNLSTPRDQNFNSPNKKLDAGTGKKSKKDSSKKKPKVGPNSMSNIERLTQPTTLSKVRAEISKNLQAEKALYQETSTTKPPQARNWVSNSQTATPNKKPLATGDELPLNLEPIILRPSDYKRKRDLEQKSNDKTLTPSEEPEEPDVDSAALKIRVDIDINSESGKSETIQKIRENIVFSGAKFRKNEISYASDDLGSSGVGTGDLVVVGRARLKSGLSYGGDDGAKGD